MNVIPASDYYDQLIHQINKAQKHVALAAMVVLFEPKTSQIFKALQNALARNVTVNVTLDVYSFFPVGPRLKTIVKTRSALRKLQNNGANVSLKGRVGLNPYSGRFHPKIAIIDGVAFSFGGVNLTDSSFDCLDYMLKTSDSKIIKEINKLLKADSPGDLSIAVGSKDTILYDSGTKNRSIIYSTACELAESAKHITYISQMRPSGKLARIISKKHYVCYFSRPSQFSFPFNAGQMIDAYKSPIKNSYAGKEFIHAKFMLFDMPGGEKIVLSGSHNFSWRGVAFGTQEIALKSMSPELYANFESFITKRIIRR